MCKSCNGVSGTRIITKRKGRKAKVDLGNLAMAIGYGTAGFIGSNFLSSKAKMAYEESGTRTYNGNISGLVKLGLAGITAWLGATYAPKRILEVGSAAAGMGISGGIELAGNNIPEDSILTNFLGVNAAPVMPGLAARIRQRRLANGGSTSSAQVVAKKLPFRVRVS